MPKLGATIWRAILNLNFYASQGVRLNYCYHIYQLLLNFTYAFVFRKLIKYYGKIVCL